jgi:hypothetical protein
MSGKVNRAEAFEDCGISLMDRIQGNGGTNITQATISSIAYSVYAYDDEDKAVAGDASGTAVVEDTALTVSAVVFDSLQTAAPWDSTADSTGYNFRYNSVAADRPSGEKWHRYEIVFTPTSGAAFAVVWVVHTLALAGN